MTDTQYGLHRELDMSVQKLLLFLMKTGLFIVAVATAFDILGVVPSMQMSAGMVLVGSWVFLSALAVWGIGRVWPTVLGGEE